MSPCIVIGRNLGDGAGHPHSHLHLKRVQMDSHPVNNQTKTSGTTFLSRAEEISQLDCQRWRYGAIRRDLQPWLYIPHHHSWSTCVDENPEGGLDASPVSYQIGQLTMVTNFAALLEYIIAEQGCSRIGRCPECPCIGLPSTAPRHESSGGLH